MLSSTTTECDRGPNRVHNDDLAYAGISMLSTSTGKASCAI